MKQRQIIFNGTEVLATLEGLKSQFRRPVKPQPTEYETVFKLGPGLFEVSGNVGQSWYRDLVCPLGIPGDRLYVAETFWVDRRERTSSDYCYVIYDADRSVCMDKRSGGVKECDEGVSEPGYMENHKWWFRNSSARMPRWASRILLEITNVNIERVQEISETDCILEGCSQWERPTHPFSRIVEAERIPMRVADPDMFRYLWEEANGKKGYGWTTNPHVWVVTFKRVQK